MKANMLILFIVMEFVSLLHAQERLNSETNMFRANDTIVKQQIEFKDPGRAGENVFWDFGKLKTLDKGYSITYSETADSTGLIAGTEHQTRYFYELKNDSLLLRGYENPTTRMTYNLPETLLTYPFKYGDKIEGHFMGEGTYCDKLQVWAYGASVSHADAYGCLILPEGDTLRHVIRVNTRKLISEKIIPLLPDSAEQRFVLSPDSINYRLRADSAVLLIDTYKWYAAGYRYPVFETVSTRSSPASAKNECFTTAFYSPPEKQLYLRTDEKNDSLLSELREKDKLQERARQSGNNLEGSVVNDNIEFTYNFYPNPVESQLNFEYYLSKDARVSFALHSIA